MKAKKTGQSEARMLTVPETAALLRLDPRTVRKLLAKGELRGNNAGRVLRVSSASAEEWMEGRGTERHSPRAAPAPS